jgi:DNA-binding transcriptional ArsR family regulator
MHILKSAVGEGAVLQGFKAELFKALGHPVRIRILELLRDGERTVSEMQAVLGIEASTVSQQLAVLRSRQLVTGRKEGTSVHYRIADSAVFDLLDIARSIFDRHLITLQAMAEDSGPDLMATTAQETTPSS